MTTRPTTPEERARARDLLRLGWGRGSRLLTDDEAAWLLDRATRGELALDVALRLAGIRYEWRATAGWAARAGRIEEELTRTEAREMVQVCLDCGQRPEERDGLCRVCLACTANPTA